MTGHDLVWDVAVVGCGPAGARAAHAARVAGAAVVLIDREDLPRYKLCGGGLLQPSVDHLPPGTDIPARAEVRRVSFSYRGRLHRTRHADTAVMRMVYRRDFDQRLVDVARRAGVEVLTRCTVRAVEPAADSVTLTTSAGPVRARAVVGADGSAGRVAAHVGATFQQVDLGLETEFRLDAAQQDRWRDRVHLDWGRIPGSYGWAFPKGDQLTVGVILDRSLGTQGRAYLAELIGQLGLDPADALRSGGHLTRCRAPDSPLYRGRVLLAGDAAGLLEPWTREGISYALRSGELAGAAAAAIARCAGPEPGSCSCCAAGRGGSADPVAWHVADYAAAVERTLGAEMRAGRRCLDAFERAPVLFHLALAFTPPGWEAFVRLSTGRTTFPRLLRRRPVRAALGVAAGPRSRDRRP